MMLEMDRDGGASPAAAATTAAELLGGKHVRSALLPREKPNTPFAVVDRREEASASPAPQYEAAEAT